MKLDTIKAPSVEEAVRTAISKYDAYEDELNVKVVEKGSKGFLGFLGGKEAVIEVQLLPNYFERKIGEYLEGILKHFNKDVVFDIKIERKTIFIDIKGIEVSRLIGRHGKTVSAFQHIVSIYANRLSDVKLNVSVDVGNYKEERRQNVENLAYKMAQLVIQNRRRVELEPMFAKERRIVHEVVSKYRNLKSYSVGLEPYRRVVIEFVSKKPYRKSYGRRLTNERQNNHRKISRNKTSEV
ncbi:single-stranded DNA-binding protein [Kosmotoga arenicorallina S304]|uniref:RNA-binding protein KhpB n=1 Tax=Kosmotoga arenicorallina S304 TaxID=1453497 RepID=A0A176K0B8_9BACT|nr:RNA-binding cell elongation regulator Jag/EloR [Kosmotoga arenicorallina]OAA30068.1 single-stranded DNA-binding protein [Kosmotoga arenicorallina S304]